ncbi:N-6 DNA methylase [Accumulibacter sp.]|uniref:N-6 DNA methylase n=1 Tax=Accumulibacter sp. TaxID=2053492 RepID=UPI00257B71CB|nr:N-6 DNA methylase [Accumulibacter sp.]
MLATGFLSHPANGELRRRIESGELGTQTYFEQLLRLVYRFIFLATMEDRELVFAPEASGEARARYLAGHSLARLCRLAARRRSYYRHADLWQALAITFAGLGGGQPALRLPALGGLFDAAQCADLDAAQLDNQSLFSALFGLCFFRDGAALSRVNYCDMDSEELGSVHESLLELVPELTLSASVRRFGFIGDAAAQAGGSTKGNARKLSGSYYTPDSLVQELIKSALDPVIAQTLAAHPRQPVQALLELCVCDPACGSGHFLLAAARRIAEEVARLSATDGSPLSADYRHALREVVAHCVYGVDRNPLAVELARRLEPRPRLRRCARGRRACRADGADPSLAAGLPAGAGEGRLRGAARQPAVGTDQAAGGGVLRQSQPADRRGAAQGRARSAHRTAARRHAAA